MKCDIIGFKSRVDSPLNHLGLYKCPYQPNHRAHIPAKVISGDKFMAQILIAGQQYMCRPAYLHEILIDLKRNAFQMETKDMQNSYQRLENVSYLFLPRFCMNANRSSRKSFRFESSLSSYNCKNKKGDKKVNE